MNGTKQLRRNNLMDIKEQLVEVRAYLDQELHPLVSPDHWDIYSNLCDMIDNISILLKEQEPRVLTLEEVKKLRSIYDGAVWLETCAGILFPVLPEMSLQDSTFYVAIPFVGYRSWVDNKYYGKTWRCWSSKPTEELREAVPWTE